jgi:hypothetical protein
MSRKSGMPTRKKAKSAPFADWPVWKAAGLAIFALGGLAAVISFSASLPPVFSPLWVGGTAAALTLLGLVFTFWSRRSFTWWARLGMGAVYAAYFLLLAIRCWYAVLAPDAFVVLTAIVVLLYCVGLTLPGISYTLSSVLWREQTTPETASGRKIVKLALSLGLGGAGALGASAGMSLSRAGQIGIAYLLIAVLSTGLSFFVAQSISHQIWPDRPWAHRSAAGDAHQDA